MSDSATTRSRSKKAIKPTDSCDINVVSLDKRTILLRSKNNLLESFKVTLTEEFDTAPSSFVLNATQAALAQKEIELPSTGEGSSTRNAIQPLFISDDNDAAGTEDVKDIVTGEPNSEVAPMDDSAGLPIKQKPENTSIPSEEPHPPVEKRERSASLDPVSDEEIRPLKKAATAHSPPPASASSPAAAQRLAGPGRTPTRVEQILSTNSVASGTGRGMQMVLDTTGASWNLKPDHEDPQRKRPHLADVSVSGRSSERGVDEEDGREVGDKASPSTNVVDEMTAVDHPDSEDEVPKSKPKPKPQVRAPVSKGADDAEPTSTKELHDSSSASAAVSNTAAAAASFSRDAVSGIQTEVARTPLPNPECDPPRASMPEPEGGHWIFTPLIQSVIQQKTMLFRIHNTHKSGDELVQFYEGYTCRTILEQNRRVTPKEGEVIVLAYKPYCNKQISVHPRFLVPWESVVRGQVVVIKGLLLGRMGVVKAKERARWVVTFSADNDSCDFRFRQSDLAYVEDRAYRRF